MLIELARLVELCGAAGSSPEAKPQLESFSLEPQDVAKILPEARGRDTFRFLGALGRQQSSTSTSRALFGAFSSLPWGLEQPRLVTWRRARSFAARGPTWLGGRLNRRAWPFNGKPSLGSAHAQQPDECSSTPQTAAAKSLSSARPPWPKLSTAKRQFES